MAKSKVKRGSITVAGRMPELDMKFPALKPTKEPRTFSMTVMGLGEFETCLHFIRRGDRLRLVCGRKAWEFVRV